MVDLLSVTSRDVEDGRIFVLIGELDVSSSRGLPEQLQGPPGALVVIDLSKLTFMDSSGLGAIHKARQLAIKDGGTLVVCRPQPNVLRILQLTGLDTWVTDWNPKWSA